MNSKRKLKPWVKTVLLLLPEIIIICQLFFIGHNVKKIANQEHQIIISESRCYNG